MDPAPGRRNAPRRPGAPNAVQGAVPHLKGSIALRSFTGADCRNRNYNRRNADYRHLHGLCSVLLDGVGPEPGPGRGEFVPFGVWMPQLFERAVLAALRAGRPADNRLTATER